MDCIIRNNDFLKLEEEFGNFEATKLSIANGGIAPNPYKDLKIKEGKGYSDNQWFNRLAELKIYNKQLNTKHSLSKKQLGESTLYTIKINENWNLEEPKYKNKEPFKFDFNNLDNEITEEGDVIPKFKDAFGNVYYSPKETDNKFKPIISEREKRVFLLKNKLSNTKDKNLKESIKEKINNLELEIATLKEEANLEKTLTILNSDLDEVNSILNKNNISEFELNHAVDIIKGIKSFKDFLFTPEDLEIDELGEYKLENTKKIKAIFNRVDDLHTKLRDVQLRIAKNLIKENTGLEITDEKLKSFKDTNWLSSRLLDIGRYGNELLDTISKIIRIANYKIEDECLSIFKVIDNLSEKVKQNSLFKQKGWDLFAETKDGKKTGNLIQRTTAEYEIDKETLLKKALNTGTDEDWKNYFNFLNENNFTFDVRYLFNDIYQQLGGKKYSDEEIENYKRKAIEILGQKKFESILMLQNIKIIEFSKDRNDYIDYLNTYITDKIEYNSKLQIWDIKNSPFKLNDYLEFGTVEKVNSKFINTSRKYSISFINPLDSNGKPNKYYNKDFEQIENNPELLDFYNYITDTFNKLFSYLPSYILKDKSYYFIPELAKTITDIYSEEGLTKASTAFFQNFLNEISSSEHEESEEEFIDEITGRPINKLKISMLSGKMQDKSYDLQKVTKAFAMMSVGFRHKSMVEDHVKVLNNIIEKATEAKETDSKIIFKGDLDKIRDALNFTIDKFYGKNKDIEYKTSKVIETNKSKIQKQIVQQKIDELEEIDPEFRTPEQEQEIEELEKLKEKYTRHFTGSKFLDKVIQYLFYKTLGWNLFSGVTNVALGQISTMIHSTGGEDFNFEQFRKATGIILNLTGKNNKKLNNVMRRFGINVQIDEYLQNNTLSKNTWYTHLQPLEFQKKGEEFNYSISSIATMLNQKLIDKNGNEINLWEALDDEGELNKDLFNEEQLKEWADLEGKKFYDFKVKLTEVNKIIHGNYDRHSPTLGKKSIMGRLLLTFRSFIGEGFANRFEEEKYDSKLGRNRKGRYRTLSTLYGEGKIVKVLSELYKVATNSSELTGVDLYNMKKNLAELYLYLSLYGFALLLQLFTGDDDDDDTKYVTNILLNQCFRLQSDITFYFDPVSFEELTKTSVPAIGLISDAAELSKAVYDTITGDGVYEGGIYKDQSKLFKETAQALPFGSAMYKNYIVSRKLF